MVQQYSVDGLFFMVLLATSDVWLSSVTNITLSSTRQFECAPTRTRMRKLLRMRSSIVQAGEVAEAFLLLVCLLLSGFLAVGLSTFEFSTERHPVSYYIDLVLY